MRLSHVKTEYHYVSVLHDVVLSLAADKALLLAGRHCAVLHQRVEVYHLCPYEALFKVGMYLAGCAGAFVPLLIVHALTSGSPAVRKEIRSSR